MRGRWLRSIGVLVALICLVAPAVWAAGAAQPDRDDIVKLRDEVARLNAQQQQILAALDELKQMVKGPSPPVLKPPETMTVAGELFKGAPAARVAIIEYADFQCPFCRRFEQDVYPRIRDAYVSTGKLKFFHRDMPLPFHEGAMPEAGQMQISGTPTFIIGTLDSDGKVMSVKTTVVGASPFEAFKGAVEPLLAQERAAK